MDASTIASPVYPKTLPAIAIRDVVLFPHMALPLSVDRPVRGGHRYALKAGKFMLALRATPTINDPEPGELTLRGLERGGQSLRMPDGTMQVFEAQARQSGQIGTR